MADWVSIKAEYISTDISMRDLAQKHGVSFSSLSKKAMRERWKDDRTETGNKVATKVKQKIVSVSVSKEVDRLTRILALGDTLLEKAERAAQEIDQHVVRNKRKEREIEYGESDGKGKPYPTKEIIREDEHIDFGIGPVDRQGLQLLSTALKNLRDVAATPRADEQSLSKLAEMMAKLDKEAATDAVPE